MMKSNLSVAYNSSKFNIYPVLLTNMMLSTLLILAVCTRRVVYELRNGLAHQSLCGWEVEHRSAESVPRGDSELFPLSHAYGKRKTSFFIFLPSSKLTIFLNLLREDLGLLNFLNETVIIGSLIILVKILISLVTS